MEKIGSGRLGKVFTMIKNNMIEKTDLEIRKASTLNSSGKKIFSKNKLKVSLALYNDDIKNFVDNEVVDGTLSHAKEAIVIDMMKKELELVVCATLRNAGYSVSMDKRFVVISWEG